MASSIRSADLIFIPTPLSGHLISAVEIAKRLVARDNCLSVSILIANLPFDSHANSFINSLLAAPETPRIRYIPLRNASPSSATASSKAPSHGRVLQVLMESLKPRVRDVIAKLEAESAGFQLAGFVVDMFCTPMIDVADELRVPSYLYYTSGAGFLSLALHLQWLCDERGEDLMAFGADAELAPPGFANRVPARVLPNVVLKAKEESEAFISYVRRYRETKGILVNSFMELESHALNALCSGCGDGLDRIPTVYPVGPIINLKEDSKPEEDRMAIMEWLDCQPAQSVVFLCFGSMGSFESDQVKEIAYGLQQCGHRFLWSLRRHTSNDKIKIPTEYENPEEVLPRGFLQQTAGIGKVIGWAPQVEILSHPSIGGFVSHCGWNSVLESLWFGVPIATWPMYAEQQSVAFTLVKELGLGVEITLDYRKDEVLRNNNTFGSFKVSSKDVKRGIKCMMEHNGKVRERVKAIQEESRKAFMEGGSSYVQLGRFLEDVIKNMP